MRFHRLLLSAASLSLLAACATKPVPQPSASSTETKSTQTSAPRFNRSLETLLNGEWSGTMVMRQPLSATSKREAPPPGDFELNVNIDGETVRVFIKEDDKWIEAMPGQMRLMGALTNAAIVGAATDGTVPEPGSWIENWSILLTALDDNSLLIEWGRVVINFVPDGDALPAFSMAATGTLHRLKE